MNLLRRLECLEVQVQAQNKDEEFCVCRELIYDPRAWKIGEEEAIARRVKFRQHRSQLLRDGFGQPLHHCFDCTRVR